MSTRELAIKFNKGQTTIRYWLNKYNIKTKYQSFKNEYLNSNIKKVTIEKQICCKCNVILTSKNSYNRKSRNKYSSYCKICLSKITLEKRIQFKQKCITYKGGCCLKCGYDKNNTALEFHHKIPQEKEIELSKMMSKSSIFITNELDKCLLLCSNCHREEHDAINKRKSLEKIFYKSNHTQSFSDSILTGKNTNKKSCRICDNILTKENNSLGSHSGICKNCDSKHVIQRGIIGKKRCVEHMGGKCYICGYNKCINSLEFHHLDPSKKSKTYNRRFKYWGFEKQKNELKNCILVCSNCHRDLHSKEEWKKY